MRSAAASGCIALVLAASISGGSIDLGLLFFVMAGMAVAEPRAAAGSLRSSVDTGPLEPALARRHATPSPGVVF